MNIEQRLATLERANRRTRRIAILLGLTLIVAFGLGQGRAPEKLVTAEKFSLIDANGREWANLAMAEDGEPCLAIFNKQGAPRITLGISAEGAAHLAAYDDAGKLRVDLGTARAGQPSLEYFDTADKMRSYLGLQKDGAPSFDFLDKDERKIMRMSLGRNGTPGLALSDENGRSTRATLSAFGLYLYGPDAKQRATLSANPLGSGLLLADKDGTMRTGLTVGKDGRPSLVMGDKAEQPRVGLGIDGNGSATFTLVGPDGKPLFELPQASAGK